MMLPAGSGFFNWSVPVWQFTSAFHTERKYSPDSILPFANRRKRAATSVGVAELPLMAEGLRCMSSSVTDTVKLSKPDFRSYSSVAAGDMNVLKILSHALLSLFAML